MRKTFKTIVALLLCVVMASGAGIAPVCAAETTVTDVCAAETAATDDGEPMVTPRAYFVNHNATSSSGSFTITTAKTIRNWSIEIGEFASDTIVVVTLYNSAGRCISSTSPMLTGKSQKIEHAGLIGRFPKGTFTVKYVITGSDYNGWIGVWLED